MAENQQVLTTIGGEFSPNPDTKYIIRKDNVNIAIRAPTFGYRCDHKLTETTEILDNFDARALIEVSELTVEKDGTMSFLGRNIVKILIFHFSNLSVVFHDCIKQIYPRLHPYKAGFAALSHPDEIVCMVVYQNRK